MLRPRKIRPGEADAAGNEVAPREGLRRRNVVEAEDGVAVCQQ